MYQVSPERSHMMGYYNGIEGFINYVLYNPKNTSEGGIRCPCKRCINKKVSRFRCCYDTSSTKRVH
jgi:hypothetical protein